MRRTRNPGSIVLVPCEFCAELFGSMLTLITRSEVSVEIRTGQIFIGIILKDALDSHSNIAQGSGWRRKVHTPNPTEDSQALPLLESEPVEEDLQPTGQKEQNPTLVDGFSERPRKILRLPESSTSATSTASGAPKKDSPRSKVKTEGSSVPKVKEELADVMVSEIVESKVRAAQLGSRPLH